MVNDFNSGGWCNVIKAIKVKKMMKIQRTLLKIKVLFNGSSSDAIEEAFMDPQWIIQSIQRRGTLWSLWTNAPESNIETINLMNSNSEQIGTIV